MYSDIFFNLTLCLDLLFVAGSNPAKDETSIYYYFFKFLNVNNDDKLPECSCFPVATLTRSINSGIIFGSIRSSGRLCDTNLSKALNLYLSLIGLSQVFVLYSHSALLFYLIQ